MSRQVFTPPVDTSFSDRSAASRRPVRRRSAGPPAHRPSEGQWGHDNVARHHDEPSQHNPSRPGRRRSDGGRQRGRDARAGRGRARCAGAGAAARARSDGAEQAARARLQGLRAIHRAPHAAARCGARRRRLAGRAPCRAHAEIFVGEHRRHQAVAALCRHRDHGASIAGSGFVRTARRHGRRSRPRARRAAGLRGEDGPAPGRSSRPAPSGPPRPPGGRS